MRTGGWKWSGPLLLAGILLAGCTATTLPPPGVEPGGFFATSRGRVTRINRNDAWFELQPKSGAARLLVSYDTDTTLLNFKGMIEITKEQPVEVTYKPGGEPANQAISIRKLQPDECN